MADEPQSTEGQIPDSTAPQQPQQVIATVWWLQPVCIIALLVILAACVGAMIVVPILGAKLNPEITRIVDTILGCIIGFVTGFTIAKVAAQ